MTERRVEYPAVSYGVLEPGLQAAIDLLDREVRNEMSVARATEGDDGTIGQAHTALVNAMGYQKAIDLLKEQMGRLRVVAPVESYTIKTVQGHVGSEEGSC